jgi:acyl-CoA reductase-like NAD-dependent aldehyde dehydrogenase
LYAVAPIIVSGNTAVVIASESRPLPAVSLAEVLATSDLPGGVVNVLTGQVSELAPPLASHLDVNALDLTGVADAEEARQLEVEAAENVKRVLPAPLLEPDWTETPDPRRILAFTEVKTVWHPAGT